MTTKFLWGRLHGIAPTTFWPWGDRPIAPMESAPMVPMFLTITVCCIIIPTVADLIPVLILTEITVTVLQLINGTLAVLEVIAPV